MKEKIREQVNGLPPSTRNFVKIIALIVGIILLYALLPVKMISPGYRGIIVTMGSVSPRIMDEGMNFKIPLVQSIVEISVRVSRTEVDSSAASKDLQEIGTHVVVNYHLDPTAVNRLYQNVGLSFESNIIIPAVYESVKFATAQFTASDLIVKRDSVSHMIKENLKEKLLKYHIILDEINIKNFNFSKTFSESIELKQKAEQDALKATNDLVRIKVEAEQKIAEARADAEALRLKSLQITPLMIQLEALKKWDGKFPVYMMGNTLPFINIPGVHQ